MTGSARYPSVRSYDFANLERLIVTRVAGRLGGKVTDRSIAMELGEDSNTVLRARTMGVRLAAAERMAAAAGFLVYEVWPEILDEQIDEHHLTCAAEGCDRRFVDVRGLGNPQRFCSKQCNGRERQRRRPKADHPGATCGLDECHNLFIKRTKLAAYCGAGCRRLATMRRYRAHPEVVERNRSNSARYYAEAGDYVRARQRRADAARRVERRSEAA